MLSLKIDGCVMLSIRKVTYCPLLVMMPHKLKMKYGGICTKLTPIPEQRMELSYYITLIKLIVKSTKNY